MARSAQPLLYPSGWLFEAAPKATPQVGGPVLMLCRF